MALYLGNEKVKIHLNNPPFYDADEILDNSFSGVYVSNELTSLKEKAFEDMQNIISISLPNCTILEGGRIFRDTPKLTNIYLPNLTTIVYGQETFTRSKITEMDLPNLTTVTNFSTMFYIVSYVKKINLPKLSGITISTAAFAGCQRLKTLILGGDELNPLEDIKAFYQTPIENGTGYVYVPDELVDTYKTATNWSVFADQIKPISELEE